MAYFRNLRKLTRLTISGLFSACLAFTGSATFAESSDTFNDIHDAAEYDPVYHSVWASEAVAVEKRSPDLQTQRYIRNFIIGRANLITTNGPDMERRLFENGSDVSLSGKASNRDGGNLEFKGKVTGADARLSKVFGLSAVEKTGIWMKATLSRSRSDRADAGKSLVHFGMDYRVTPDTIVGVTGQYDIADETNVVDTRSREGWLVGPYLVSRFTDTLVFDGHMAVGHSANELTPQEARLDDFDSTRLLVKGQVSGDFRFDAWNINPAVSVVYFEEDQNAYTTENGALVPEQLVSLGRISFGPRASKTFHLSEDVEVTPEVRLRGTWDFDKAEYVSAETGIPVESEHLRARLDGALTARLSEKQRLIVDGYYDGIGVSGYGAYGVKFGMKVLLE